MDASLLDLLESFAEDITTCASAFKHSYSSLYLASAVIHNSYGIAPDAEKLNSCKQLLKDNVKFFNPLRGIDMPILASYMSISGEPMQYLNRAIAVQGMIKEQFPWHSTALSPALAVELIPEDQAALKIKTARSICDCIAQKHPLMTKSDKVPLFLMMAMSSDIDSSINDVEHSYENLKKNFFSQRMFMSLAMSLDSTPSDVKCHRAITLHARFKEQGTPYSLTFESPCLSMLAISGVDLDKLLSDVAEVVAWMSTDKRFGFKYGLTKSTRTPLAAHLVLQHYANTQPEDQHLHGCAILSGYAFLMAASQQAIAAANN